MNQAKVKKRNGRIININFQKIQARISKASRGLKVKPLEVATNVIQGVYDGITTKEIDTLIANMAASYTIDHPDYSKLAANIAVSSLHKDTLGNFGAVFKVLKKEKQLNEGYIKQCEEYGLAKISSKLDYTKDFSFDFFGYKTLEKSYLLRNKGEILERPQEMYMRVAITVTNTLEDALDTYKLLSNHEYTHATPTLFNAGLTNQQLASCFLLNNKGDSKEDLLDTLKDTSIISSGAGGIGLSIHNVRAAGSHIHSSGGRSNGILPLLKTYNESAKWWDQSFTGETLVKTNKGEVPISKLKKGDKVLTSSGKYEKITDVKNDNYTGELLNINGVNVTPEHPIYVVEGGGLDIKIIKNKLKSKTLLPIWKQAKEISLDDFIIKM
jgi:ribonucleoside-diphosphate reductase alpha chain